MYTNSPLVTYKNLTSHYHKRKDAIDTITIHCYVGQVTAKQGCDYFRTTTREVSSNYVVGCDGSIGLSVEERNRSWCSSSPANDHRAITIEVACDKVYPYTVTPKAYAALLDLCEDICKRNNIKALKWKNDKNLIGKPEQQNMTVHRWFKATECPGQYLFERMGQIAEEVNKRLNSNTARGYSVQTGAFGVKANAVSMADNLTKEGFECHVQYNPDNGYYIVQTPTFPDRECAEAKLAQLENIGVKGFIKLKEV